MFYELGKFFNQIVPFLKNTLNTRVPNLRACVFYKIRILSFGFVFFVQGTSNFQELWLADSEEVNQHLTTDFF